MPVGHYNYFRVPVGYYDYDLLLEIELFVHFHVEKSHINGMDTSGRFNPPSKLGLEESYTNAIDSRVNTARHQGRREYNHVRSVQD